MYHHIQHIEDTVLKDILEGDMSDIDYWIILTDESYMLTWIYAGSRSVLQNKAII